jgi:hypothetical protein
MGTALWPARLSPYRCLAGRPASELLMEIKPESFVGWTLNGKEILFRQECFLSVSRLSNNVPI